MAALFLLLSLLGSKEVAAAASNEPARSGCELERGRDEDWDWEQRNSLSEGEEKGELPVEGAGAGEGRVNG